MLLIVWRSGFIRVRNIPSSSDSNKYVLSWQWYYMIENDDDSSKFPELQCRVNNCIFTGDKNFFGGDHSRFDAIFFYQKVLELDEEYLPINRSDSQVYVFATVESAYNYPACETYFDDFFNLTLTFRLDSDISWPYFLVRDLAGQVVAPKVDVKWPEQENTSISSNTLSILSNKTRAAAWLVSHCRADSLRDEYLTRLSEHLYHFSLEIDVFGKCSNIKCRYGNCAEMFTRDYYFYMAFENSFAPDYVTEKVLHGYNNYAVPIVYGGANYTRFLPPGSYINAHEYHPYNLAYIMYQAIKNPSIYYEYFKWRNFYTIDAGPPGTHPLCKLCEVLNTGELSPKTYPKFRLWWNLPNGMKWCLPQSFWNEMTLVHVDNSHIVNMY
uniref:Fucosyltransferase n=1 Tax=Spodoptera frugiperda TaxID=7108 RepID=A0A2H1WHJ5_SPOFR